MESIFNNPTVKTIASAAGGAALVALDHAINQVSGGMLSALNNQPVYAALFTMGALFVHNLASRVQFQPRQ